VQLVPPKSDIKDRQAPEIEDPKEEAAKRVSLRPLLQLRPYLFRYPSMLAVAFLALLVAAAATLAVPLAMRRMIDLGFSGVEPDLIDIYFATLVGVGVVLALASAARFYCVNWLGERVVADIRADVFKHLTGWASSHAGAAS
jgi:ATP-binding cassette subfamily B protein